MSRKFLMAAAIAVAALAPHTESRAQMLAADAGLVVMQSAHDMATTESRLKSALEAAGLAVAFRLDHSANAQKAGLKLPPTVLVVFGNPKAGTVLMEKGRTIGIDLPLKVLIWEADGKVNLAYNDPAYLAKRHGLNQNEPVLGQVGQALKKLGTAATSR